MLLISSFFLLSVIGTFSLALFLKSTALYNAIERTENRIRAFHLAESGVDRAIFQLRTDPNYIGQGYTALGSIGGYDIQVTTPGPVENPTVRLITATGHSPSNLVTAHAYGRRQVLTYVTLGSQSPFAFSVFSNSSIQMSGNAGTDSYNSSDGLYNAAHPGTNGDVGSNTTSAHFIALSGNTHINGDVTVGPGGNPSSVIVSSGNAVIEGSQSAASQIRTLNPVVIPSTLNNLGVLSVSGNNTVTLAGGTYWYSSISITGNGKVNFTGAATVYVSGNVSIAGNGFETAQNLPPNLTVNVQGTHNVSVSGNGAFYGAIYAPNSGLSISGNGGIFGAVVGESIQHSGNGKIHYDEALNSSSSPHSGSSVQMRSWQEA